MRLDRYICQSTGISRSQVRPVLNSGRVTCQGEVIKSARYQVQDTDQICLDDQPLKLPTLRYLMLNKPVGYVSATEDSEHATVLDLLPPEVTEIGLGILHPAGRLDIDSTGLLLLTDDGQWSHRLTSPRSSCRKRYRVQLKAPVENREDIQQQFAQGIMLHQENQPTAPATIEFLSDTEALVEITEGRYHQVKRMIAAVGNRVVGLHREAIGSIELDEQLAEGEYRQLTREEIAVFGGKSQ